VRDSQAVARTSLQRRRRYQRAQQNTAAARWHRRRPFLSAVAVLAIAVVASAVAVAVGGVNRGGGERGLVGLGEGEADDLLV
jgi:hypothetical protein